MINIHRISLFLVVCLLLPSCSKEAPRSASNAFYYNESDGLNTLDPARIGARAPWWIGSQIFTGLVGLDDNLNTKPLIAKSWEVSTDGLVWTFNLRSDVKFADDDCFQNKKGRKLTAADIKYSFERICNPTSSSTGFWIFRGKVKGADEFYKGLEDKKIDSPKEVTGFEVVNDSVFKITLVVPFAPFLSMLSIPYAYIVPIEAIEKYGQDFQKHPVGAGPFVLISWKPDEILVLKKNSNYYEKDSQNNQLPYLDSVVVTFIKDSKTEFLEFSQGKFDMVSNLDPTLADVVFDKSGKNLSGEYMKYHLHLKPALSVEYYGFNLDESTIGGKGSLLATNKYLRKAINWGIDRKSIIDYVLKGKAIEANYGPIPPGTPGFAGVVGYMFDKERALKYLDSAGFPNGKGLPEFTLQIGQNEKSASIAETIQDQLKKIGIKIKLVQVDFPQHREMILDGKLPFWRTSWIADYPDAENFMALFYSPNKAPQGPNTTHYSNKTVDSLYKLALNPNLKKEERMVYYARAERVLLDDAPWVFLYYSIIQRITQPNLSGYSVDALDRLSLTRVKKVAQLDGINKVK
ncbi:MAG: ABC transporter substrate-binding protein [Chlorobiota bacterium]|nr:ABC transporter substrate-binding protein [Chlorobiota bacterium]QQS66166.1 MAG: ABC transporter substrate-binding protein [Chlorobiota bacterium]